MGSVLDWLHDIKCAIERIEFEQLMEKAVRSVADEQKALSPLTPWPNIVGVPYSIFHNCFRIDLDEVWHVVSRDVVPLKRTIVDLIAKPQTDIL